MGMNSTLVILNDALHLIEKDKDFGRKVAEAIKDFGYKNTPISSGHHCNAASVVDCHHADHTNIILVGGNVGTVVVRGAGGWDHDEAAQERMLRYWASRLGLTVSKKRKPKAKKA